MIVSTLLTLIFVVHFSTSCPLVSELEPCYCNYVDPSFHVTCPGLENDQRLMQAVFALRLKSSFFKFTIKDGVFMYIPQTAFKGVRFQQLEILNSTFMSLTDGDVAFEGLWNSLLSLVIRESVLLNDWDWLALRNLKSLVRLHVDVDLEIVSEDIAELRLPNLKDLNLADNQIKFVDDHAFARFNELRVLSLQGNQLKNVKRSMLPSPAHRLWHLDFSNNQIEQLPPDLFENMPYLVSVSVKSNKLLVLSRETFENVWSNLKNFTAQDNPLRCDCRMEWMTKLSFPGSTNATCKFPQQLQGKQLTELTALDLWC